MKISDNTISILKNFSTINPSILVNDGNVLATVSPQKSVMAKANVSETFAKQFAIYDLSRFLGVASLMKDPEYSFMDKFVEISTSNQTVRYMYTDPDQVIAPPSKEIAFPDPEVSFVLSSEDLSGVIRAGSVLQMSEIAIHGDGSNIFVSAVDSKNTTSDTFSIKVGSTDQVFNMIIKTESFKLINATYQVSISSARLLKFQSDVVTYWVAAESNSTFGE